MKSGEMSAEPSHRTIPVKRRNGKLQSCEPCRKRKLSCDHRLPACGRCIRRGTTSACYYHPAPLTKPLPEFMLTPVHSDISSPPALPPHSTVDPPTERFVGQGLAPRAQSASAVEQRLYGILSLPSAGILMESLRPKTGFLGMSSSSAVVAELNDSLGIAPVEENVIPPHSTFSDADVRSGAQVLAISQDMGKIRELFDRRFESGKVRTMYRPIYLLWLDGVQSFMEKVLLDRQPERFERHSLTVWRNTQQPMHCHRSMSAQEWALQATGNNLRWETLGLILATAGIICAQLPSWDPTFKSANGSYSRIKMMKRTMNLANICVDLSRRCGSRNDAYACMHYEYLCLVTMVIGDTSIEVWTGLSEVCDTMTLMGLHLEQRMDDRTPFFLCELRARLFNYVFSLDKFCSTFLGRPPHLSYRYSVIQDIHDLTDEEICGDPSELGDRLAELGDNNGWTVSGPPHISTWRRAWVKRHVIREDILEIVIGPHPIDLSARISKIRELEKEALEWMPYFVRLNPEELLTNIKRDPSHLIPGRNSSWRPYDVQCFLSFHCAFRHSDFLLERARVNKLKADPAELISSARSLLGLVLKAQGFKDFLREFQMDFTDMLAFYGVPPAGVLAMEILKRDQLQDPYDDFPRSETLQQLSVFVTALESVDPEEGNFTICSMGLNATRKVLDRLLSRPSFPVGFDASSGMLGDGQFGANFGNDADFLQWLGNVDFDTTTWLDSANPQGYSEGSVFHAASL